jgi:hypothetical protein
MIRRDDMSAAGPSWILISQVDHALLAGQLAEHWSAAGFAPLAPRDALLWAVNHHDDGWRAWEAAPTIEPRSGHPRTFTEMPVDEALTIWSASIALAAAAGSLEGYVVAGHFAALARQAAAWQKTAAYASRVAAFLADCDRTMPVWLDRLQAENPTANTPRQANRGLRQLQFFDALSLWFCMAERQAPYKIETPDGPAVTFEPTAPGRLLVAPWPLSVEHLQLELPARSVPAVAYRDAAALAAAPSQPTLLRWRLQPHPES